jgi:hypothetical protein
MIEKIGIGTIVSILALVAGIIFYIGWGVYYGVWVDIGIYSVTIVLVLGGVFGLLLTFLNKEKQ